MPIPNDYSDICDMLLKATREGRVKWTETSSDTFVVRFPEYNLEIWGGTDETDKGFVAMGLKQPDERRFSDNWFLEQGDEHYPFMNELYGAARRAARRIPDKLTALRTKLQSEGSIGLDDDDEK